MEIYIKYLMGLLLIFSSQITQASSGGNYIGLLMLESCGILSDEYKQKSQYIISRWKVREPELFNKLEILSKSSLLTPDHKARIENFSAQEIKESRKNCDEAFANMEANFELADDRFSSPEKTWAIFLQSLKIGDKDTIVKSLSGREKKKLSSFISSQNKAQLMKMGKSFNGFQIIGNMKGLQEAIVTRANGVASVVLFVKKGENWKIEEM